MNNYPRFSSKFSVAPALGAMLISGAAACLLASFYTYAILHIHNPYLRGACTVAFGSLCGILAGSSLTRAKVGNSRLAGLAGGIAGLAGLYTSWGVWLHEVLARLGVDIRAAHMLSTPTSMWDMAALVNAIGTWSMEAGVRSRGAELWFAWTLEAIAILGGAILASVLVTGHSFSRATSKYENRNSIAALRQPAAV